MKIFIVLGLFLTLTFSSAQVSEVNEKNIVEEKSPNKEKEKTRDKNNVASDENEPKDVEPEKVKIKKGYLIGFIVFMAVFRAVVASETR